MQHYKALKEATYGSRMVKVGEIIAADEGANLDASIWQAVSTPLHACAKAQEALVPMGMNTDPRVLSDYTKLQQECAELRDLNTTLTEQHADALQQAHVANSALEELQASASKLHDETSMLKQQAADKEKEFADCMHNLQAENASLKKQLEPKKK